MHSCNLCGGAALQPLIDFGHQPVVKHYLESAAEERPTWPVKLFICEDCGLSQLVDSCPPEVLYENYFTLSSWKFQPHVQHEIDVIAGLEGVTPESAIVEIGSNDGMFLHELGQRGYRKTLGIEPTRDAYELSIAKGLDTLHAFLTPQLAEQIVSEHGQFDLFVSRQNLEHISDLPGVARSIDVLVKPGGYVLVEVPNYEGNLRLHDYALWEEHVNYFTSETLRRFLASAGVEPLMEETFVFSGESFYIVGRKTADASFALDYVPDLLLRNAEYAARWPAFRERFDRVLSSQKRAGKRIAVYGAGSRTFCLLNFAGVAGYLEMILDDQPEKQNRFMPGGRLPIVPGEALYSAGIDICLLAVNTENEDKVIGKHARWVRGGGTFWSILPPSDRLLPIWRTAEDRTAA